MASTLLALSPLAAEVPASNYPTFDVRNNHPVLDFDATTDETCYFTGILPRGYLGAGVTVDLHWAATSATAGACRWQVAVEALAAQDTDADGFATANSAGSTTSATAGVPTITSIAFTDGAQMDSLAAGGAFRLRVNRDADGTSGTDDMTGDAELLLVEIRQA